jgi:hypothetical protein
VFDEALFPLERQLAPLLILTSTSNQMTLMVS